MAAPVPTHLSNPFFLEPAAIDLARGRVEVLIADFRAGAWAPTPLESRVAELLLASTTGDGMLTARRVRAALWEGDLAMTYENDGRFAQLLADLVPVLDEPELTSIDIVDAAGELVAAIATTGSAALAA
ncbi:hypothetical protein [Streptomyces zaomyceticus]|uniref:hypothetical protein n=1 Tax=Streptomyces zaomyceticus TaxID=68286 RepID=UPI001674D733|nr:hypothetical protein [Streptomyces zaomyceticus]GHG43098.1 hypothetical protein GCM10018791_71910 [Streptomyces zaomyceticus]